MNKLKIEQFLARLSKVWEAKRKPKGQIYVHQRIAEYRCMWKAAADEIGARFNDLADDLWEIEFQGKKTRILNDKMEFDNPVVLEMAGMKPVMYRLFKDNGLPVPEHVVFNWQKLEQAIEFMKKYPEGCVIKPANGTSSGQGVTTHIQSEPEVRKAAVLASLYCPQVIIEPMIPGECYRILVLQGKMIHAVCRRTPRLKGDGILTVARLIEIENDLRSRKNQSPFIIDRDVKFTLDYQGISLDSIPENGREFLVNSVNEPERKQTEVRTVYNTTVTDQICHALQHAAEKAAKILKSDLVGVDFITTDPTVSLEKSGGFLNEVNTTPGLHHHYNSRKEKYPEPAIEILNALLNSNFKKME